MALMSQIFVVSVSVQLYKCICLYYIFLWCTLMFERQINLKLVGVFVAIISFIFTNPTERHWVSVFLSFGLSIVLSIIELPLLKNQTKWQRTRNFEAGNEFWWRPCNSERKRFGLVFWWTDSGGNSWCPWYINRIGTLLQSWILLAERSQLVSGCHGRSLEVIN